MENLKQYDFSIDWSKPILVCITGASRGIGKQIAIEIAERSHALSRFILIARDLKALEETKAALIQTNSALKNENIFLNKNDFAKVDVNSFKEVLNQAVPGLNFSNFNSAYIIHNAGTLGVMQDALSLTNAEDWLNHFNINVTSTILLNSAFIERLRFQLRRLVVVNITSLCGRLAFKDLAMYGTLKAAREQYFRVVALENPTPDITVLNYSPGPVETDMYTEVVETAANAETREMFQSGRSSILTPKQTVTRLLGIVLKDDYESGTTVDYFDKEHELRKSCLVWAKSSLPFSKQIKE